MRISGGIDVGTTETRSIYIESGWKNVKVAADSKNAKIIASVPSQVLTFRHFSIPFADRRKIKDIIREELSDSLAFSLEDAVWDFHISSKGDILAVIARSGMLKEVLTRFPAVYQLLDAEPFALARCALYSGIKDALIIDFGASKTVFCSLKDGALDLIKVLLKGGEYITGTLSQEKTLSREEAEQLKRAKGMNDPLVKNAIVRLLRTANLPSPFPYPKILITGRGAQMDGLKTFLEENLKTPVATFELPEGLSPYTDQVAFGMALKEREPAHGVNLMEEKKVDKSPYKLWLALALIPIILFSINLKLAQSNLRNQIKNFDRSMNEIVKREFPEVTKVKDPVYQFRSKLESKRDLLKEKGNNVLGILDQIAHVTAGKDIKIYEIDMNEDSIRLTGETVSYQEVETMRKNLSESFKKVELQEGKTLPSKRITFTIIISMKESEESNGKT